MKRMLLLFALACFVGAAVPARGAGFIIVEDSSWRPGPNPPIIPPWPPNPGPWYRPHPFAPLEVSSVKVRTHINDQLSTTSIEQEFYNPNPARLEGTFVFPVPKGAHLDKFAMEIDGKSVEAELLDSSKARHLYEEIVRKLRDPALLEYADRDLFKVRIFPIEPNSTKRISLSYSELLKSEAGLVNYLLPLSAEKFSSKPVKNVSVRVDLETKRPLKSIYSPTHAVEIKRDGPNRATAAYESSQAQPNDDFALYFAPEKDELGINLLTSKSAGEDGYFLLLASPGMDVKEKHIISKDVVIVLDTSGSMAGPKLSQAKKALQFCVENLNDGDRFELLRFSTEVEPLFDKLVEASSQNRSRAEQFVKDLTATGGTAIDDALRKALSLAKPQETGTHSDRPFVVIFLTDGQPTIGTTDENQILTNLKSELSSSTTGEKTARTRVFCFGIGTDVNTHLLDRITEETRGSSQYVLPEEDIEVKVSNFFSKIKEPVLASPELRFTGDIRASKLYPSALPDLFKGEQLVLAGRYSGHGNSAVIIEGTVNGDSRKFTYEVKFPEESSGNEFIPRLWATRRVGYLLDEIRLHGENNELKQEVTDLARKYAIVTPYTTYLILEDESSRNVPVSMRMFRNIEKDDAAKQEAAKVWNDFKEQRDGSLAVGGARYGSVLKMANAPAEASALGAAQSIEALQANPAGAAAPLDDGRQKLITYSQQSQFAGGKTFFRNETQWTDSEIQKHPNARHVRIQFASPEYFDLVARNPEVQPWVALGQNVQFLLGETVYEVY